MLMALVLSIPIWAGEKTVTISRNEGIYDDGTGVYYCTKGGVTMTFSSGLNNVNYLVEHQQVVFDIFTTNYVIKKIKFNCLDNTTNQDETFYWGPSTIHELGAVATYVPTGTYTYNGFVGTWVGGSTPSKYVKFVTEARPVRFGSVEITYDKEYGDIYEKVTSNDEIEDGQTYALVSQYASKALGKEDYYGTDNLTTFTSTPVTLLDNNNKVKVTDEVQLIKLQSTGYSSRPWYIKVGDNYMRRRSGDPSGSSSGAAYGQGYNLYSVGSVTNYEQYFRVSISVSSNTNQNALIRFEHNSTETAGGKTFAIRHYNGGSLFRDMDFSSNNQYAANQRVYLYKPAQSYEVITECIPTNGGYITLGGGILTDDQGKNWSQHFDNVTFFVGTANGYGIGEVTLTDINTRAVTILQPTATSDFGNDYSFEMPANDVKITANFVQPYDIHTVINPDDDSGSFEFIDGYTDFNGQPKSNEGKTVTFKPVPADGYSFNSVTITDDVTGETTTMTPDADGVYSFVMPGNSVTLTANFEAAHDLYLLGTANGRTGWVPYGPKFTFDGVNEKYYIDVYFKGGNDDPNTDPAYGYFSLTKRISDPANPNWNDLNGFRLAAENNNTWVEDGYTGVALYGDRPDNAFKIKPGVYRIKVNKAKTQMSIIEYPLTLTFNPVSGTTVAAGATVDISSNLNDLVHGINADEVDATFKYATSTDGTLPTPNIVGSTVTIEAEGATTTVNAEASIGYIVVPGNANYTVPAPTFYSITTQVNPAEAGTITTSTSGAAEGATVDFTVTDTDASVYTLIGVEVVDSNNGIVQSFEPNSTGSYSFTMPDDNVTIHADYERTPYNVTTSWSPSAGGSVWLNGVNTPQTVTVPNADPVVFGVAPSAGYALNSLTVTNTATGQEITPTPTGTSNEYSFTMPAGNVTIVANFSELAKYNIHTTVTPENGGTFNVQNRAYVGETVNFTFVYNQSQAFDDYYLYSLTVTNESTGETVALTHLSGLDYRFVMPDADVTIAAVLKKTHQVTTSWTPQNGGYVGLMDHLGNTFTSLTYGMDDTVKFIVTPNPGFVMSSLVVDYGAIEPTFNEDGGYYTFVMPDDVMPAQSPYSSI